MNKMAAVNSTILALLLSIMLINQGIASEDERHDRQNDHAHKERGHIVIANRASGTLSIIDVRSDTVSATIALPSANNPSQPMYVVHSPRADRIFVGDRANNRVVVFDDEHFDYETSIPAGNGIFHMWADPQDEQLWVNNDIDNTATVIDPVTLEILGTVAMPEDLVALGGKPHDVILDPIGRAAFVTMVAVAGDYDYVVKFETNLFTETARAAVGKDPHVSLTRRNKLLYVPTQNSNAVFLLSRKDLSLYKTLTIPGAHGAGMTRKGKTFYVTNISGGGADGLYTINTKDNEILGQPVDTPFPTPHNIALTARGNKLYITHSGASADQVSVFNIDRKTKIPVLNTTVTVGLNPFGLAYVR